MIGAPSTDDVPTRLMINKMVLENFKSYAGMQEIGPFHKRFSSIVGPNGSGKSNVIDALLFVFGKRASEIRLKKVSELIHKSSRYPSLEYARVSVHFQLIRDIEESPDDFNVVPGSEFTVTRVAYTNNSSKYTIDGRTSTYTEVGTLLRSHGIDLDNNRFLILQGEVEQIAMMKPKAQTPHEDGLLEYLEDIIGSNKYVEKIGEAEKELDTLNENRTEKINRLKVAERERDNLSGSKAEAEAYLDKEKEIRRKKNVLFQIYEAIAKKNALELTERLNKAQGKLAKERSKLTESEATYKTMEVTYEATHRQHSEIEAELQRATSEFGAFERRDVKLQEDMKHLKAQQKKAQANIAKDLKREEECLRDAEEASKQAEAARASVEDVRAKKTAEEAQVVEIMSGLQEATKELRSQLEAAQIELADAERGVAGFQTEKEAVEMSIKLVHGRVEAAAKTLNAAQEKIVKLQEERVAIQQKTVAVSQNKRANDQKIASLTKEIDDLRRQEATLQANIRTAVASAEEAKAILAAQAVSGKSSSVVSAIMKAAKKGGPLATAGVRGRLGDLATIAPEYDVAISTACGVLDYIVVDTTEGGQACIRFLKENQLGRVTVIVLDQMDQWRAKMDRTVSTPEGNPRLFDLITPKHADLRPAFYMALRDTLVAPDLETAVRVAYVGDRAVWRVVTKDGNLIDTSGAMSGGGNAIKSGSMLLSTSAAASTSSAAAGASEGEKITPAQVEALEAEISKLQSQLANCRARITTAENELQATSDQVKRASVEAGKLQMALKHAEEQEADYSQQIASLADSAVLTPAERAELETLQGRIEAIDKEILRVSPQLGQCKSAVASLQRRIMDVGGPRLSRAQAKVDILTKQFDALSATLSAKEVEEATNRKQAVKAAASREKSEVEAQKATEKLAELTAEQKEMENDALEVIKAVELAKSRMAEQEELLRSITAEFHELKAAVAKIKSVEVDLGVEIEHTQKEVREANKQVEHWRRELEVIRKLHIDEQREFYLAVDAILKTDKPAPSSSSSTMTTEVESQQDDVSTRIEALTVLGEEQLSAQSCDAGFVDEMKKGIALLEAERDRLKGNVNMNALMEYLRKDAHYRARLVDLEAVTEARNVIRKQYEGLRRQRLEEFMTGFGVITLKLKEMYQMITLGGDAELELVDSLDPFSEGIVFSVRPPKKSWKNISNLSGGEKTLSSLALVFALHHYKPTPLYVMDEIDAALDFKNVSIVANYIKERTKNAQFVIISLRNNMFELADRLVGIYKTNDATKSVTINPKLFHSAQACSDAARPPTLAAAGATVAKKQVTAVDTTIDQDESTEGEVRATKVKRIGGVLVDTTNMQV